MNDISQSSKLPERIRGLERLAQNLWWSWNAPARELFRALDLQSWHTSGQNPVQMLALVPQDIFDNVLGERVFLAQYDAVMEQFEQAMAPDAGWFPAQFGISPAPLAYLSAEYGLHYSLPLYAGGLGMLAGDHLKECSDLAVPVVGVGIVYEHGYFKQRIREDGWQEDVMEPLDRTYEPITRVLDGAGKPLVVQVPALDPPLHVAIWQVQVGRVALYLMDADLDANPPWEREITHHIYAANPEERLRQEIVLGMGGMRLLDALGIQPAALHINEGHPAFAILERIRMQMERGASFDDAAARVRASTIFTTHTPLPAGTDVFPYALMQRYFDAYLQELGIARDTFYVLGATPQDAGAGFNMTVFALRMSAFHNAVSQRHAQVARTIWASVFPNQPLDQVPIAAITNGVHLPSWIEPTRLQPLLDTYLHPNWRDHQDERAMWELVEKIPDAELWDAHQSFKMELIHQIDARARERWQRDHVAASSVVAYGTLLDPSVLTVGFARRFTGYKRPTLILSDLERLKRLLLDALHPLQIIFAGKAHPADIEGKQLIQQIFRLAQDPQLAGRIAFLEDYDEHLAQFLVHGVDVWLNNPLPPLEASGTSGIKAGVNGTPNLSILDGWWIEGYNGANGWAFGGQEMLGDRYAADAQALYTLLEEKIIPLYYHHSHGEPPREFVKVMKASLRSVAPAFSARRMLKEYFEQFYLKALGLVEQSSSANRI